MRHHHHHFNFSSKIKHFVRAWGLPILFLAWCAAVFVFFAKIDHGQNVLSFAAPAEEEKFSQKIPQLPPLPVKENQKTEPFFPLHLWTNDASH